MIKKLEKLGLSQKQAKIYLACLKLGSARIQEIAHETSVKRSTVYVVINSLKKLGLIKQSKKQKTNFYLAENPQVIKGQLNDKQKTFDLLLPQLQAVNNLLSVKPKISYFEGPENLKQIYLNTTKYKNQIIYAWCAKNQFLFNEKFSGLKFIQEYIQKRIENNNYLYMIIEDNPIIRREQKNDVRDLRQMKFFKTETPFNLDIFVYGEKEIALLSATDNLAIVIESQFIAQGLKKIFLEMWQSI